MAKKRTVTFTQPDGSTRTVTFRPKPRRRKRAPTPRNQFIGRHIKKLVREGHKPTIALAMASEEWECEHGHTSGKKGGKKGRKRPSKKKGTSKTSAIDLAALFK